MLLYLCLRTNKSFVRAITDISYSEATDKMIEKLRKELNDCQMDESTLYGFKDKTNKIVAVKLKEEDFILPAAFPWTN